MIATIKEIYGTYKATSNDRVIAMAYADTLDDMIIMLERKGYKIIYG